MTARHAATADPPAAADLDAAYAELAEVKRRIQDLRAFEIEYRARVRAYLQDQLAELAAPDVPDE